MMNFKENMDLNNILAKAIYLIDFIYPPAKAGGNSIHGNEYIIILQLKLEAIQFKFK